MDSNETYTTIKTTCTNEDWKDIQDFDGRYAVSNFGRVRNNTTGRILKPALLASGYLAVALRHCHSTKTFLVHRLVASAFVNGKIAANMVVNHIDGDKTNNAVSNLEWCSYWWNSCHARKSLGHYAGRKRVPVMCVNTGEVFHSVTEAALSKGISRGNILAVLNGKRATAGGLFWWHPDRPLPRFIKGGRYQILCVETGEVFNCVQEAMNKYGKINIYEALRGNREKAGGYHWRRIVPEYFENARGKGIM